MARILTTTTNRFSAIIRTSDKLSAVLWTGLILYTTFLTVASLLPSGGEEFMTGGWDASLSPEMQNVLHVPAYAVLAVLLFLSVGRARRIGWAAIVILAVACTTHGAILEWFQATMIPGRYGDWLDVLCNATGVAGGCLGWLIFRNIAS